jgi:hypothetical protein
MACEVATKAIGILAFRALMGTCGDDSMCKAGVVWHETKLKRLEVVRS